MPSDTSHVTRDIAVGVAVTGVVLAALTLVGLALTGVVGAASPTTQSGDTANVGTAEPTLRLVDDRVPANETTEVRVALSSAPDGLAGYYLRVTVADPGVARIENASYPGRFAMTTAPEVVDGGRSVVLEAADLNRSVQPGAGNVTLATLSVAGVAPGEVRVTVEPVQFDADGGSGFEPAADPGVVTVIDDDGAAAARSTVDDDAGGGSVSDGSDAASPGTDGDSENRDGTNTASGSARPADDGGDSGLPAVALVAVAAAFLVAGLLAGRRL